MGACSSEIVWPQWIHVPVCASTRLSCCVLDGCNNLVFCQLEGVSVLNTSFDSSRGEDVALPFLLFVFRLQSYVFSKCISLRVV